MNGKALEHNGKKVSENIWLCGDGVYRWYYELDMLRNPIVLFTVWKVLGIAFGAVIVFTLLVSLFQRTVRTIPDLWGMVWPFLILIAVFFVISIISYLILAATYGWKYVVLFEMTEDCVRHIQAPKQFQKAQALGWLTALAGVAAGNPAVTGMGLSVDARNTSTSEFKNVAVIKPRRRRDTIHVNQRLNKNQIYVRAADFDFVEQFLKSRCPNAKIH